MGKKLWLFIACLFVASMAFAQKNVTGQVVDAVTGEPVIGASVRVVGNTGIGAATDINGNFRIQNIPNDATKLLVTYIGMQEQQVTIKSNVKVFLQPDSEALDQVVVIGYGSARKIGSMTGSVGTVDTKKLEMNVSTNFTDALAGQVAGLSVLSSSGDPSASASIRLRGINTINASSTPLFILDGAPISSVLFNSLNPNDIESITVLKDASATAIYGSRAANGVIVITSKKGSFARKAEIKVKAQYGFSKMVEDQLDVMDSYQYMDFREMIGAPLPDNVKSLINDYGINTNWRSELFDMSAPTYDLDASISGGSESLSYYISANHHDQEGIIAQSGLRRDIIRANINARVNDWFKVGIQTNLGYTKYETNSENSATDATYLLNPAFLARFALPYDSPYYYDFDEDGNIVYGDKADYLHYGGVTTPDFVRANRKSMRRNVTLNLNAFEEIRPINGLTIRAQQAIDAYDYNFEGRTYPYDQIITPMGDKIAKRDGSAQRSFERYYSTTLTNTAEYKFHINNHHVALLAGQEAIISKDDNFAAYAAGHTDIRRMRLDQGVTISMDDVSEGLTERVINSFFFQGNYNFAEKYFFDGTLRRDGSSVFSPDNRWSTFFSVGGRWDMKKENWLKDISWLDEFAIRASYGTVGNSGIGDYAYFGLLGQGSNYNGRSSIGISQASNYDLTWETIKSANFGFSAMLFNRLNLEVDYYNKKTVDMLLEIPYSYTTGLSGGMGNVGSMVNRGVDVVIGYDILKSKDFYWNVKANFNYNYNEITELFDGRDEFAMPNYSLCYKIGHDVGEFYVVDWAGVDPRDGKQMWYDKNGNLTKAYNEERDAKLIGKSMFAPWYGGFGTEFAWKGLSIKADFAWALNKYLESNDNYFLENPGKFGTSYNQSVRMLDIWTKPGDVTNVPAFGEEYQFDSHLIENASFLRLKSVIIQYNLPSKWFANSFVKGIQVFGIGRNLLTWTDFTGYDPEPERNLVRFNYPNTRQFVFGAEFTF
ncbi:MAG: TonB-dependent receptor [Bacteroidaceae bacterium]|nr:TonB-dependent receptor [Bacteroidaceae bacterium]